MADVRPDRRLTMEPEASRLLSSKQSNGESRLVSSHSGSPDSNPPPLAPRRLCDLAMAGNVGDASPKSSFEG